MFLTLEDPRGRVKGSRDPLGVQPIWSAFGRRVIGNLTTQTDSCRGFAVLLLGRYFVGQLVEDGEIGAEDALDVFLRFEQICGYARHLGHDSGDPTERILGVERISRRSGEQAIRIDATREAAILSDQKAYGLWGLYSVSARASNLLRSGSIGVSDAAAAFIESRYLPQLQGPVLDSLKQLIREGGDLRLNPPGDIVKSLGQAVGGRLSPAKQTFFREHLCEVRHCDQSPPGLQAAFCKLLEEHGDLRQATNRQELASIREHAEIDNPVLAARLRHILTLEALLGPCDVIFGLLRARHGQSPGRVAEELHDAWGGLGPPHLNPDEFEAVLPRIARAAGSEVAGHMRAVQQALHQGGYERAILQMLPWNEVVMTNRNAAPWIRLDGQDDTLDVRYRGPEPRLPSQTELDTLWRYSYFIDSLKALLAQTSTPPAASGTKGRASVGDGPRPGASGPGPRPDDAEGGTA